MRQKNKEEKDPTILLVYELCTFTCASGSDCIYIVYIILCRVLKLDDERGRRKKSHSYKEEETYVLLYDFYSWCAFGGVSARVCACVKRDFFCSLSSSWCEYDSESYYYLIP